MHSISSSVWLLLLILLKFYYCYCFYILACTLWHLKYIYFSGKEYYERPITLMFIDLSKNLDYNWKIENPSVSPECNRLWLPDRVTELCWVSTHISTHLFILQFLLGYFFQNSLPSVSCNHSVKTWSTHSAVSYHISLSVRQWKISFSLKINIFYLIM